MYPSDVGGCWLNSTIYPSVFDKNKTNVFPTEPGFMLFYKETVSADSGYPEDRFSTRQVYSTIYLPSELALKEFLSNNYEKETYKIFKVSPVSIKTELKINVEIE